MIVFNQVRDRFHTKKTSFRNDVKNIFPLTKIDPLRTASDLNSLKIFQDSKIFNLKT